MPDAAGDVTRALARRVRTRILRDLLPRLSSDAPLLLVAVAGPNNVGKSTLFNTLVAADLSPARAEGGLTQQCLAA
ncbi:MAG TPA: GTPase, partial [Myxococcaceae bacterium]